MSKKKVLLIDGYSVAFRAFYGLHSQLESMKNRNGLHTNAIFGFHNMLESIMEKEDPSHVLVAFDAGKTTFRHDYYEDYKGGREGMPSEFSEQVPYLKEMVQAFGIQTYQLDQYEADDIIGTLTTRLEDQDDLEVVVLTGDRDLMQLATNKVRIALTKKGVSDVKDYTADRIQEELGIKPKQIIDMKGLAGDSSDNIPGVTRIGEKTAIKLLKKYHSVEELYDRIDEMNKSKRKDYLIDEKETAYLSKKLATIDVHSPIEIDLADLAYSGKDLEKLVPFYREMDFNSQLDKLNLEGELPDLKDQEDQVDYTYVTEINKDMLSQSASIYLEILEEDYLRADLQAIAWGSEAGIYVTDPDTAFQSDIFRDWLESPDVSLNTYDAKALIALLNRSGIQVGHIAFDIMLASYLLTSEDASGGNLYDLASKHNYSGVLSDVVVYGKGKNKGVPDDLDQMYAHLASKVKAIMDLTDQLTEELHDKDQDKLYYEIELPLAKVLADMEIQGIKLDIDRLEAMKEEFSDRLKEIEAKIFDEAGEEFNINSPKQLSHILFEKMGYPVIKKTKTGYSTAQDVLEKLRSQAPIVEYILQYRTIAKIQSTYVQGLINDANPDTHKVHTRYQQTVARTGRLSSVDPNLQNIPIRTEEGSKIRKAFVPRKEGWQIFAADYSQIELRVLAHMSQDQELIQAYLNNEDIHTATALQIFGLDSPDEVTGNMRREAKAVNFGIVYGISDYGLSQNLNISRKEAKHYIDTYFSRFPGVKDYIDQSIREAKDKGYVATIFNRRRYLPDINSRNFNLRSFAERTAMNTPIQGSAADIIKVAMIQMAQRIEAEGLEATMLLQVHDELIFEAPEAELETLEKLVSQVMEEAVDLDVPLKVDSNSGPTWFEAK